MSEIQERRDMIAKVHEREKWRAKWESHVDNGEVKAKKKEIIALTEADDIFIQEEKRNIEEEMEVITEQLARINGSEDRTMMDKLATFAISEIKFIKEKKLRDLNVLGLEADKALKQMDLNAILNIHLNRDGQQTRQNPLNLRMSELARKDQQTFQALRSEALRKAREKHAAKIAGSGAASAGGGRKKRRTNRRTKRRTNRRTKRRKSNKKIRKKTRRN
jgi:hypothetical protein